MAWIPELPSQSQTSYVRAPIFTSYTHEDTFRLKISLSVILIIFLKYYPAVFLCMAIHSDHYFTKKRQDQNSPLRDHIVRYP
jgi:Ca2+/H+ antiporter